MARPSIGPRLLLRDAEEGLELERAGGGPQHDDAGDEAEVAELGRPERLHRRARRGRPRVPVADQQVRAETDQLPEHEHLEVRRREDEPQHREREQRLVDVVAAERRGGLVVEIRERVELHEQRHERDEHEHRHRQVVDQEPHRGHRAAVARQPRHDERAPHAPEPRAQRDHERRRHREDAHPPGERAAMPQRAREGQEQERQEREPEHEERASHGGDRGDRRRSCDARGRSR